MKFSKLALSAVGASVVMFASAPAFAAAHTGKPMAADMAASKPMGAADAPRTPQGEKSTVNQDKGRQVPATSNNTRAEVKQEVKAAKTSGTAIPAGERITPLPGGKQAPGGMASTETRSEVKKEAIAAEKTGSAVQAGEALSKAQQKGQKQ